jgi:hypothetical protein
MRTGQRRLKKLDSKAYRGAWWVTPQQQRHGGFTYHHFIELLSPQTYGSTRPCSAILHWTARWRTHILLWRRVSYASYSPSTPSSLCRRLALSRQRLARCLHLRLRHPTIHRRCKQTHYPHPPPRSSRLVLIQRVHWPYICRPSGSCSPHRSSV